MMRASWQRLDPGKAKVMPVGQGKHLLPRVGVGGGEGGRPRCRPALRTGLLSDPGLLLGSQGAAVGESASFRLRGATRLRPFLSDAGLARNPRHLQTALLPTRSALGGLWGRPTAAHALPPRLCRLHWLPASFCNSKCCSGPSEPYLAPALPSPRTPARL